MILYLEDFSRDYRTSVWVYRSLKALNVPIKKVSDRIDVEDLLNLIKREKPDILLFSKVARLRGNFKEVIDFCKKNDIYTVCWLYDLYYGTPRSYKVLYNPIFKADLVLTTDGGHQKQFKEVGVNHRVLRQGVFQEETDIGEKIKTQEDIVFIGNDNDWWKYRYKLIRFLKKTYDHQFKRYGNNNSVRGKKLNDILVSAKITIGDSVYSSYYWSNRLYEMLGRGAFLLFPKIEGIENEFKSNKHFVPFQYKDFEGLKNKIDYYLEHDKEREEIRKAGHKYCKENYTYLQRCKDLIKIINEESNSNLIKL